MAFYVFLRVFSGFLWLSMFFLGFPQGFYGFLRVSLVFFDFLRVWPRFRGWFVLFFQSLI